MARLIQVKIHKGQKRCSDKHGNTYKINGLLIKRERGGEVLYTLGDNEHFVGRYSKGDFFSLACAEGTLSYGFLIDRNLINLI